MNKRNPYAEAITCLQERRYSDTEVVYEIARHSPSALVAAVKRLGIPKTDWRTHARLLIQNDGYIEAIKHCRAITGWGLKEAKDAVDVLRAECQK